MSYTLGNSFPKSLYLLWRKYSFLHAVLTRRMSQGPLVEAQKVKDFYAGTGLLPRHGAWAVESFQMSLLSCMDMPWKGLHFNRGLDISSMALWYVAPKVHIISHKNKHCNPWHKEYMLVHLSPKWHRMGMQHAATEGWKFQKLPQKQVEKKAKLLMGDLKVQELFGQYRLNNSYFYYKWEHLGCFKRW